MFIYSSSPLTSTAVDQSDEAMYAGMSHVFPTLIARRTTGDDIIYDTGKHASGKRDTYFAQVRVNSPAINSIITRSPGVVGYLCFGPKCIVPSRNELFMRPITGGTDDGEMWSSCDTWLLDDSISAGGAVAQTLEDVRRLIATMRTRQPIQMSTELRALIGKAAEHRGAPTNAEQWSRQIADDVRGLLD